MTDWEPVPAEDPGCPMLVWDEDGPVQCGLLAGHRGDCTTYVPGCWPFPPILHPLDLLRAWIGLRTGWSQCPNGHGAGRRWHYSSIWGWRWLYRDVVISLEPAADLVIGPWGERRADYEYDVVFEPCGCRFSLR